MKNSIVTQFEDISAFSGRPAECKHHLIFGIASREIADQDGVWIPLTNDEHNLSMMGTIYQIHGNPAAEKLSKIAGQLAWEKHYIAVNLVDEKEAREWFMKKYGKSFL